MLARTVARVDDRHRAHRRGAAGRALLAMTQHDHVGVSADDADGVLERFPLCSRGELTCVVGSHRAAPETQHRRLEGEAGPGRRFVEQRGHHLTGKATDEVMGFPLDLIGA